MAEFWNWPSVIVSRKARLQSRPAGNSACAYSSDACQKPNSKCGKFLEFAAVIVSSAKTGGAAIGLGCQRTVFEKQRGLLFEMLANQFGHLKHGDLFFAAEDRF